jgi:hypothetical protein
VVVTVLGGWMVIEGLLFLAIGDKFIAFSMVLMRGGMRWWAIFASLAGVGLVIAAALRF